MDEMSIPQAMKLMVGALLAAGGELVYENTGEGSREGFAIVKMPTGQSFRIDLEESW